MPYISNEIIEDIKFRNNIEDVISSYVTLKRAGSNLQGLCPFHSEKTPSFTVFSNEGNFYCFGCGAGGDVISFIRKIEGVDYPSAIEILAKRAGITIVHDEKDNDAARRRARILEMNREAAKYFNNCLLNTNEGSPGLEYLTKRGLSTGLIRHFGLGFAPDGFGKLTSHLAGLGYKDYEMSSGFLCGISKKNGKPYDYFRNRVIFPIIDTTGEVIAFGGRVMDNSLPKYLNTSDTPAFKKSRNLYALNYARKHCSEQIILCEGYMDVIALHGYGFENAVATLGTAITPEQARLMKRYTKSVVISYDSDEAGQRAADKAFRLLGEVGLETKVLKVTDAKDPDEFLKKFGSARFKNLLNNTRSEFDFRLGNVLSKYDINVLDDKIKALDEIENIISNIYSDVQRELYIRLVADKLQISADSIKNDVARKIKKKDNTEKHEEIKKIMAKSQGIGDRVNPDYAKNPQAAAAEEKIIGILLLHPEYLTELRNKGICPENDDFFSEYGKKVFGCMLNSEGTYFDISTLGEFLSVDEISRLTSLKINRQKLTQNTVEVLEECITALKRAKQKTELSAEDIIRMKRQSERNKSEK